MLLTAPLTLPLACAGTGRSAEAPDPQDAPDEAQRVTTVRVQNQAFLDMNVYVSRGGGGRTRLGTVTGNSTAVLRIPRSMVQMLTALRFAAVPIGGRSQPVSEEITVSPGDEVGLLIPPNAR